MRRIGLMLAACALLATPESGATSPSGGRVAFVVSDFHMGLGRTTEGGWNPREDFRWPLALAGFLEAVSAETGDKADLVIAGDFLELWQRPPELECGIAESAAAAGGASQVQECRVDRLVAMVERVVQAHAAELRSLSQFAARGENCVVVLPGNHDAALVLDQAWAPLRAALAAAGGCVRRPVDGIWVSPDGGILIEHGHQIGWDANKYDDWPTITKTVDGVEYVRQPWGEAFVQRLFNEEEAQTPLIDNLSPSSAGVRHRMSEQGLGSSVQDVARFLRFNLFDTSLRQKIQFLGEPGEPGEPGATKPQWDVAAARKLGHELFILALPPDDPFAAALRGKPDWAELRSDLDQLARDLPEPEVLALCDQIAIRKSGVTCATPELGAGLEAVIFSREGVLKRHLIDRKKTRPGVSRFIYGHTHSFELPWNVPLSGISVVRVANSGAFQRLIDDERLVALSKAEGISPFQFLKQRTPESLPACYTAVAVSWTSSGAQLETRAWSMAEDGSPGRFVDPCSEACSKVGHGCGAP